MTLFLTFLSIATLSVVMVMDSACGEDERHIWPRRPEVAKRGEILPFTTPLVLLVWAEIHETTQEN